MTARFARPICLLGCTTDLVLLDSHEKIGRDALVPQSEV
jgi:hypothetical protein